MEKYWDKAAECMSRDELSALQSQRLVKLVESIYENVRSFARRYKVD